MRIANWFYAIPLRVRSIFRRSRVERELDEELRYHLEQLTQANIAKGMSPGAARYQALRAMQGIEQQKEECRDTRGVNLLQNISRDLRYAARMLRKNPAFTAVAVLSLALGIGANTAIFSLIDTLLLRPLPVPHPEQLRTVSLNTGSSQPQFYLTYPMFSALRSENQVFSHLFAWTDHSFQIRSGSEMVHVDGAFASGDYFSTLGVPPVLGRTFTPDDDHPFGGKDGPVVVISDHFWSREFQRSPSAVGRSVTLDGIRFTVIGVMPPNFFGSEVGTHPEVWAPLWLASNIEGSTCLSSRNCWWLVIIGRLKTGVSQRQADARLKMISRPILQTAGPLGRGQRQIIRTTEFSMVPATQGWSVLRLRFSNPLAILMSLVGLVLLIACANMANLLLARASSRQREIAVRLSLGASRARIVQQLLTESLMLSIIGAAAGCLFAIWLARILLAFVNSSQPSFGPGTSIQLNVHPDWRIALFTLLAAIGSGILFGFAPAFRATRRGSARSLKEGAHQLRGGEARAGIGRIILPIQAALSVLLVAAAGLFAGSLFHLLTLHLGFDPRGVTLIAVNTDRLEKNDAKTIDLYRRLLERTRAMPGVQTASLLWFPPLSGGGWDEYLSIPGKSDLSEQERDTFINSIAPRFLDAMKIPLLAGRQFTARDTAHSEKVGLINDLAARRFFPNRNAVGSFIVLEKEPIRIVGVVSNIKYLSLRDADPPELYIPYTQITRDIPSLTFAIKSVSKPQTIQTQFRAALRDIAPNVPIQEIKSMQEQVDDSLGRERLMASLSVFFGALALLLTSIGLYGTLAYAVARRTGEIGIRMALGARGREIVWLVLRGTVGHVAIGVCVGIAAALAAARLVRSLLYGMQPNDPGNLMLAVLALLVVAAVAGYIPARRASRLDPTVALREE